MIYSANKGNFEDYEQTRHGVSEAWLICSEITWVAGICNKWSGYFFLEASSWNIVEKPL